MRREMSITVLLMFPLSLAATTIHVPGDQPTIQAGIAAASAGDTVLVASRVYYEQNIVMKSGVYLTSETGEADCVTIDALGQGRIFYCDEVDNSSSIVGFTITGGWAGNGGGMYCHRSSPEITNCVFDGNSAPYFYGGGMYCETNSRPTLTNCTFLDNWGYTDGGGMFYVDSSPELVNCTFSGNSAAWGGGVASYGSYSRFTNCTFEGNWANNDGGAVYAKRTSPPGEWSFTVLINCTITGNHGEGVYCDGDWVYAILENCIISFGESGEAVYCDYGASVACCDIYGNEGGDWVGCIASAYGVDGNICEDPFYCDAEAGNFTLADVSPCLPENNECGLLMGAHGQGCTLTAVDEAETPGVVLMQSHPNPFNPRTTISFTIDRRRQVHLAVYDLSGRIVSVLSDRIYGPGRQQLDWDGRDAAGRELSSGIYFARLESGESTETKKLMLVR